MHAYMHIITPDSENCTCTPRGVPLALLSVNLAQTRLCHHQHPTPRTAPDKNSPSTRLSIPQQSACSVTTPNRTPKQHHQHGHQSRTNAPSPSPAPPTAPQTTPKTAPAKLRGPLAPGRQSRKHATQASNPEPPCPARCFWNPCNHFTTSDDQEDNVTQILGRKSAGKQKVAHVSAVHLTIKAAKYRLQGQAATLTWPAQWS